MSTLCVTAAGSQTSFDLISAARKLPELIHKIVVTDSNNPEMVTSSIISDEFEKVAVHDNYLVYEDLLNVIKKHSVDVFVPILPGDLKFIGCHYDYLINKGVTLPLLKNSVEMLLTKNSISANLLINGIPTTKQIEETQIKIDKVYFAKPNDGFGSRGVSKISGKVLLETHRFQDYRIEEVCFGPEVTTDCFANEESELVMSVSRERLEVKSGVTTKAKLFQSDLHAALGRAIAKAFTLRGTFCFQTMQNDEGETVVTDINPRPGAGTSLSTLTGNDFHKAHLLSLSGEESLSCFYRFSGSVIATRQFTNFITRRLH